MRDYHSRSLSEHNQRLWIAYRHDMRVRNLSEHTVSNYFQALYAADSFFAAPLGTLTRLDIKAWLSEELSRLKDTTVRIHFVGLRVFYNWMVKEELLAVSPMKGMDEPAVAESNPRIPTDADLKALLRACSGSSFRDRRDTALFRLMLEPGGLRRAEVVSLRVDAVDITNELIEVQGKGNKVRYITYGARTGQALMRYLHVRDSHKDAKSDALWLGRFGPLSIYAIGQILETRCDSAGIERIKPHALRHAAADRSMAAGVSDLDMMTLFGWSNPSMLGIYARSNRLQRALASVRDKKLGDRL